VRLLNGKFRWRRSTGGGVVSVQQRLEFSFARCLGGRVARLRHTLARGLENCGSRRSRRWFTSSLC